MASMTAKQVASLAKLGEPTRKSDGKGLYFVVPDSGAPYWALRYSGNSKRKQMTQERFGSKAKTSKHSSSNISERY
ncbi:MULTISPECIES: Arm DNA-binding domain-containing protein [Rheinheimera]|uniref:Arm DNA-binding domain-containing protein n=1 Tax=Rheinheimera TaxID=67575 RepID=UPI001A9E0438|nr:Arm DNA-binding domain-containing protein [Rheinheimera sp. D18]